MRKAKSIASLGGLGDRHQRQAELVAAEAEARGGVFDAARVALEEQALCRGTSLSCSFERRARSCPAGRRSGTAAQSFGATLEVTEMQPVPPWALKPSAVMSSPDSRMKSAPSLARCRLAPAPCSAVASLTPTMLACASRRRAMVSTVRSTTVRPGTLVEQDRQRRRLGHGGEVLEQALLRRLVVVGHDRKHGIGADRLRRSGSAIHRLGGRVRAGAGDHRHALVGDLRRRSR